MGQGATVLTIGHSTRSFDEVLSMLRVNDVTDLVDVRAFPSSGRFLSGIETRSSTLCPMTSNTTGCGSSGVAGTPEPGS
jgi:hypothetical protein